MCVCVLYKLRGIWLLTVAKWFDYIWYWSKEECFSASFTFHYLSIDYAIKTVCVVRNHRRPLKRPLYFLEELQLLKTKSIGFIRQLKMIYNGFKLSRRHFFALVQPNSIRSSSRLAQQVYWKQNEREKTHTHNWWETNIVYRTALLVSFILQTTNMVRIRHTTSERGRKMDQEKCLQFQSVYLVGFVPFSYGFRSSVQFSTFSLVEIESNAQLFTFFPHLLECMAIGWNASYSSG